MLPESGYSLASIALPTLVRAVSHFTNGDLGPNLQAVRESRWILRDPWFLGQPLLPSETSSCRRRRAMHLPKLQSKVYLSAQRSTLPSQV